MDDILSFLVWAEAISERRADFIRYGDTNGGGGGGGGGSFSTRNGHSEEVLIDESASLARFAEEMRRGVVL